MKKRNLGIAMKTLLAVNVLAAPFIGVELGATKVFAASQTQTTKAQVSTERVFQVPGKGDVEQLKQRDRRQYIFSPDEPTGLYASPNEKIIIQVEGTQSIQAFIGTESYDGKWNQDSIAVKKFVLKPGENTIESPKGGMIYFYNPEQGGSVQAEIKAGGTPTPLFELGKHTKQDLVNMLDMYPNAHAVELKGERSLVTASVERVKKYLIDTNTDPVELLKKLDDLIRMEDKVAGLSEEEADKHYIHFVEDTNNPNDSSAAYAFPGRTAYTHENIKWVLDINKLETSWGVWHEMGHMRQQPAWQWKGLGEVTNNIFSLSVQRALGQLSQLTKDGRYEKASKYLNQPQEQKDFNAISDGGVKLAMFWQLDLAFGEDFYPQLYRLYRETPSDKLPQTDNERIQDFIYNTSTVAKQNLLPFFDKWGLIATPENRQRIEALNLPILTAPIWEATESIPKESMKVIASSEETVKDSNGAINAIDGKTDTFWHSNWSEKDNYPFSLTIELDATRTIARLGYLPRQDNENGRILNYNIYTSEDGVNYQKVTSGTWENSKKKQFASFNPVTAKYVKLEVVNGMNGYASAEEIDILEN
ncbi:M60 family metallopeptidase [Lysinibacillus xylanilyticus]|uniref:M60 family metallopeptidase n=1 Tax=Lysinibacillus xylanilyticus TaxID=582475 RepID=UPI003D027AB1